jgi:hypothetical protein
MSGHHLATGRRAPGRKRGARFESSEALAHWQSCRQWRAQPWSCMDAAPGCRLQRRSSANILTAWPGRLAQAPRAVRARAPWSCSPCWRPSSRTARLRDQLRLDDEASSQIADGGATGSRLPGDTSVGDLPTSSASWSLELWVLRRLRVTFAPFFDRPSLVSEELFGGDVVKGG